MENVVNVHVKPALKFADISKHMDFNGGKPRDNWYYSNVRIKCNSKVGGKDFVSPVFIIYSYIRDEGVRVWGLSSPTLDHSRFYKDFSTALKWANILYDDVDLGDDYDVQRSFKVKWYSNNGTKKCPVFEEHVETKFYYANPAY